MVSGKNQGWPHNNEQNVQNHRKGDVYLLFSEVTHNHFEFGDFIALLKCLPESSIISVSCQCLFEFSSPVDARLSNLKQSSKRE